MNETEAETCIEKDIVLPIKVDRKQQIPAAHGKNTTAIIINTTEYRKSATNSSQF